MPIGIMALLGGWRRGDVGGEAEHAEEGVEEAAPFVIVRCGELENDGNVGFDVDSLKNCGGRRVGGGIVADRGGEGDFGGVVGVRRAKTEEGIVVHGGHGDSRGEATERREGGGDVASTMVRDQPELADTM